MTTPGARTANAGTWSGKIPKDPENRVMLEIAADKTVRAKGYSTCLFAVLFFSVAHRFMN